MALAHGREVHGQPKKLARITLENRDDLVVGTVERNGIEIATATCRDKQQPATSTQLTARFDFGVNLNLQTIRHIAASCVSGDHHPAADRYRPPWLLERTVQRRATTRCPGAGLASDLCSSHSKDFCGRRTSRW